MTYINKLQICIFLFFASQLIVIAGPDTKVPALLIQSIDTSKEQFSFMERENLWKIGSRQVCSADSEVKYYTNQQPVTLELGRGNGGGKLQLFLVPGETLELELSKNGLSIIGNSLLAQQNRLLKKIDLKRNVLTLESDANELSFVYQEVDSMIVSFKNEHPHSSPDFYELLNLDQQFFKIVHTLNLNINVSQMYRDFDAEELKMLQKVKEAQYSQQAVNSQYFRTTLKAYLDYLRIVDPKNYMESGHAYVENEIHLASYFNAEDVKNYVTSIGLYKLIQDDRFNPKLKPAINKYGGDWTEFLLARLEKFLARVSAPKEEVIYPLISGIHHDDSSFNLSDLKGKWVIIELWATWCGPCRRETPYVEKLKKYIDQERIEWVYLSLDDHKDIDKWKRTMIEKKLTGIRVLANDKEQVHSQLRKAINQFIIITPEGKVQERIPTPSTGIAHHLIMGL